MENAKAIQGNADGLCGFYALINFLTYKNLVQADPDQGRSKHQEAFRYLAEAAERLRLLTPIKLVSGYEWHELREIFNSDASQRCTGYRAYPIHSIKAKRSGISGKSLMHEIIEQDGAAVVAVQNGGHWVLVYDNVEGELSVADPSYRDAKLSMRRVDNVIAGVVILPDNSILAKIVDA